MQSSSPSDFDMAACDMHHHLRCLVRPDGVYTAPTDEALAADLIVLKQLGFNTLCAYSPNAAVFIAVACCKAFLVSFGG